MDTHDEIEAFGGTKYSSEKVFVAMFKHLKSESDGFLKKQRIKAKPRRIQWIVTVPAIWNDKAKYKMKKWMIEAGLIERDEKKRPKDQCRIVYEPDWSH